MEAAIRNALARAESPDKAARARIYHSAFEALKRNIEKNGIKDQALLQAQGSKLKDLIVDIEAEYGAPTPMLAPVSDQDVAPENHLENPADGQVAAQDRDQTRQEPAFGFPPETHAASAQTVAPVIGDTELPNTHDQQVMAPLVHSGEPRMVAPEISVSNRRIDDGLMLPPVKEESADRPRTKWRNAKKAPRDEKTKRKHGARHVFASGFSGLVLLSFFGIGLWWVYDTGAFQSAETRDTGVPNPPPQVSSEDYEGNGSSPRPLNPDAGFSGEWTTIYAPQADESIEAGSDTEVALSRGESGNGLQIRSTNSGERGEVSIPIDAAALQQLAGRRIVLALTIHSISDEAVQYYIKCDFGTLGDCGRHRFESHQETKDALFEVDFTRQLAPNEDGKILINADIFGTGRGVELFSVRARPAN